MRAFGWVLLGGGLAWLAYALTLDTSVPLSLGSGWPGRVQNLSLMEYRRTQLMLSGGAVLVGVLLIGFAQMQPTIDDDEATDDEDRFCTCPFCAESVHVEAVICKHCRSELPKLKLVDGDQSDSDELVDDSDNPSLSYRELRAAADAAERRS